MVRHYIGDVFETLNALYELFNYLKYCKIRKIFFVKPVKINLKCSKNLIFLRNPTYFNIILAFILLHKKELQKKPQKTHLILPYQIYPLGFMLLFFFKPNNLIYNYFKAQFLFLSY